MLHFLTSNFQMDHDYSPVYTTALSARPVQILGTRTSFLTARHGYFCSVNDDVYEKGLKFLPCRAQPQGLVSTPQNAMPCPFKNKCKRSAVPCLACVAGGIRGHKGGSLKYRLPKN